VNGLPGGISLSGPAVSAADLEVAFSNSEYVYLQTAVTSVFGKVPSGKTLYVVGNTDIVTDDELLIEGGATLHIWETGTLTGAGIASGLLKTSGADPVIQGEGGLILPIIMDGTTYTEALHYDSPEVQAVASKMPGSKVTAPGRVAAQIEGTDIPDLFAMAGVNELIVYNVELSPALNLIPAGKKLTLRGNANSVTGAYALGNTGAQLIVAPGARLTIDAGTLTANAGSTFTNGGTVILGSATAAVTRGNGTVTNNGVIETDASTVVGTLEGLLNLPGSGTIKAGNFTTPIVLAGTEPLNQNLVLDFAAAEDFTLPNNANAFGGGTNSGKTITVGGNATLVFQANTINTGATIINKGTISTATTVDTTLTSIFGQMNADKGKVVMTADLTALTGTFEIPAKVELTLNGAGATIATGDFPLTITGILLGNGAVLAPAGNVIVNGTLDVAAGSLTVATTKTLNIGSSAKIAGTGTITVTDAEAVTINNKAGYSMTLGVVGDDFGPALTAITAAVTRLKDLDKVATPPIFDNPDVPKIIGSVDLSESAAAKAITRRLNMADDGDYITFEPDIVLTGTGYDVVGTNSTAGPSSGTNFTLALTLGVDPNHLTLIDSAYNAGGTELFGVVTFNDCLISKSNLVAPEMGVGEEFSVGVKVKN
jgi:hypothetical protein